MLNVEPARFSLLSWAIKIYRACRIILFLYFRSKLHLSFKVIQIVSFEFNWVFKIVSSSLSVSSRYINKRRNIFIQDWCIPFSIVGIGSLDSVNQARIWSFASLGSLSRLGLHYLSLLIFSDHTQQSCDLIVDGVNITNFQVESSPASIISFYIAIVAVRFVVFMLIFVGVSGVLFHEGKIVVKFSSQLIIAYRGLLGSIRGVVTMIITVFLV